MGNKWRGGRIFVSPAVRTRTRGEGAEGPETRRGFPPSSAPTSAISRGNEMKKWRANSHNKADNRAIKITFARPKKAKRNQKREEKKENFVSYPPPFYGHLGARVEKFLLCGNHLRFAAPPRRRLQTTHFPNTSCAYTRTKSDIRTRKRERERRRVDRCWSVLGEAAKQPASQPAGWPTNQPFHIPFDGSLFPSLLRNEVSPGVLSPGNIVWQGPPRDNISDVC